MLILTAGPHHPQRVALTYVNSKSALLGRAWIPVPEWDADSLQGSAVSVAANSRYTVIIFSWCIVFRMGAMSLTR